MPRKSTWLRKDPLEIIGLNERNVSKIFLALHAIVVIVPVAQTRRNEQAHAQTVHTLASGATEEKQEGQIPVQ